METQREHLLAIYAAGLDAVRGDQAVYRALSAQGATSATHVVAIGKAAEAMFLGAERHLGETVHSTLLITKTGHFSTALRPESGYSLIEAAHPVPDDSSLAAGQRLITYLQQLPAGEPVLFLISGGASSLCEVLADGWTLEELRQLTRFMLGAGYAIGSMNAVRQRVSRIKGGKLWQFVGDRPVQALLISDVEGDHPASIGSGLLFPPEQDHLPADLPTVWQQRLPPFERLEPPAAFQWQIVASNALALEAMQQQARQLGYPVRMDPRFLNGEAGAEARQCVAALQQGETGMTLWGGETTVRLPPQPGRGGRNQHFALSAAVAMQGQDDLLLLAAGTDGSDGLSADAGALVDSGTCARGEAEAGRAEDSLQQADSGHFLEASADLIHTGPTGTNVMDVVIGLKC
ncbi:MAG TPA: DUF4147 domain-containing protein [Thiolinea sp.]|nr:DUF4147 domain-containing protein [Thiolinea sp.]